MLVDPPPPDVDGVLSAGDGTGEAAGVVPAVGDPLPPPGLDGPFDLVFVDADKESYWTYYSELLPRLRTGGVIVADNVLWSGRVADSDASEANTRALQEFNERVVRDERVDVVMLPVGDGVSLIYKR